MGDNSTERAYPIPFSCSLYRSKYTYSSDYTSPSFHSQISPFSYTPPTRACAVPPSGGRRGSQDEGLSSSSQFLRKLSPRLALVPAARVVLTSSRHLLVLSKTNFFGGRCMTFLLQLIHGIDGSYWQKSRGPWLSKAGGVHECWSLFKRHFLHAQERCIPLRKKSSKGGRRPVWLNKELLAKIRWKRKVHGMWKEGQAT